MNAPATSHETSPPNPRALPDAWVAKILDHMAAMYGSKFSALWGDVDPAKVRAMWAHKLAGFADRPEAIKRALDALDSSPFPPTLPEFLTLCRDAAKSLPSTTKALPPPPPADPERAREFAGQAKRSTQAAGERDMLDWIKRPASQMAHSVARDAMRTDSRIRSIVGDLIRAGRASEEGRLLQRWDSTVGQWVKA